MKVLWMSNCVLGRNQSVGSGSWLFAMKELLHESVHIVNLTLSKSVKAIKYEEYDGFEEYILPDWKLKGGVPKSSNISEIRLIIEKEKPDVVHIWGMEKYWALLFSRGYIHHPKVLLEIQGVLSSCYDVFWAGLTPVEFLSCHSVKNIIAPWSSLEYEFLNYKKCALYEQELLSKFKYISTQSNWTRNQISNFCSKDVTIFRTLRPIRKMFYESAKWRDENTERFVVFSCISYCTPFKGLHILFRAIGELKQKYPDIKLVLAGRNFYEKSFIRKGGYEKYLCRMMRNLNIVNNVEFLGKVSAEILIKKILDSNVVVNPSFVESYSAASAESLYLGAPTVLSFSGAMPDFSEKGEVALYYPSMDYRSCAACIERLYEDKVLVSELTRRACDTMASFCDSNRVLDRQLEIYNALISK